MVHDWEQIQFMRYAGSHLGNRTQDREDYSESDEDRTEVTQQGTAEIVTLSSLSSTKKQYVEIEHFHILLS